MMDDTNTQSCNSLYWGSGNMWTSQTSAEWIHVSCLQYGWKCNFTEVAVRYNKSQVVETKEEVGGCLCVLLLVDPQHSSQADRRGNEAGRLVMDQRCGERPLWFEKCQTDSRPVKRLHNGNLLKLISYTLQISGLQLQPSESQWVTAASDGLQRKVTI